MTGVAEGKEKKGGTAGGKGVWDTMHLKFQVCFFPLFVFFLLTIIYK